MLKKYFYILIIISLSACKPDLDYEIRGYTEKIIVEGWIANGEYPRVYLSLNVPLSQPIDSATILEKVIRTAKVTISDGINTEILTSRWDRSTFPPYVYKGTDFKGEAGKTYDLMVEYSGYKLTAQTTIPFPADVQSFTYTPTKDNDSLKILSVKIQLNEEEKMAYMIYSKKNKDAVFLKTANVFNENLNLKGLQSFIVSPDPGSGMPSYEEKGYFLVGDTVTIKIKTIDSVATDFFKGLSGNAGMGKDIFVGHTQSLKSNISEPGYGVWYGTSEKNIMLVIQ